MLAGFCGISRPRGDGSKDGEDIMVQGISLRLGPWRGLLGSAMALLLAAGAAGAAELQPGLNAAGIIAFPTALDQPVNNTIQGTIAVFDLGEPAVRAQNLRY